MRTMPKSLGQLSCICLILVTAGLAQAQSATSREVRPVSVVGNLIDVTRANDEFVNTRANAGSRNYAGANITIDVGGIQNITGVIQRHGRWPTNYPGAYKVEVADSPDGPWIKTFEGPGRRGESRATFDAVRGRFVRITATDPRGGGADDWSIAELRVIIDPGAVVRNPPRDDRRPQTPGEPAGERGMRDIALAFDRNPNTRATSGTSDYAGAFFTFDLKGEYELSRVVQVHGEWRDDYPAEYKVEVSRQRDEGRFHEVWRGAGRPGRSVAEFNPVITRYVRITALRNRDRYQWWSIAELRTNRDPDVVDRDEDDTLVARSIRRITARGLSHAEVVGDESNTTRSTTETANYAGSWIQADMGGSYTISKVVQVHNPDERDHPGRYRIEVSSDGASWQTVWQGQGERGRSVATFRPVRARYVRITAIANHDLQHPWSIYKLRVRG